MDLGAPQWAANCCASTPAWLVPAMLVVLAAALALSMQLLWLRARERGSLVYLSGLVVAIAWWALAAWIVLQPMQMRGLLA